MSAEHDEMQGLLDAYRDAQGPGDAARARMWEGIDGKMPPDGGGAAGGDAGTTGASMVARAVLGLGAAGLVAWLLWPAPAPEAPAVTTAAPIAAVAPQPAAPAAVEATPAPAPTPMPTTVPEEVPEVERAPAPKPKIKKPAARPSAPVSPKAETAPGLDLDREVAQLRTIQGLQRSGSHAAALEAVRAHRKEFPKSALDQERSLIEVELLCELGREDRARQAAARFQKRWPGSHLAGRLPADCVAPTN